MLEGLGALVGGRLRLWRFDGRALRVAAGPEPGWSPPLPQGPEMVATPGGEVWMEPIGEVEGFWLEVAGEAERARAGASMVLPALATILDAERNRGCWPRS